MRNGMVIAMLLYQEIKVEIDLDTNIKRSTLSTAEFKSVNTKMRYQTLKTILLDQTLNEQLQQNADKAWEQIQAQQQQMGDKKDRKEEKEKLDVQEYTEKT